MTRFIVAAALCTFISACATSPIATSQAISVPASRVLDQRWLSSLPGSGSFIVKRDTGILGSGCMIRLYVDSISVADLRPGEKVELFLPTGEHLLGAGPSGICGGGSAGAYVEASVIIAQDRDRLYRIAVGQGGILLQPTAF